VDNGLATASGSASDGGDDVSGEVGAEESGDEVGGLDRETMALFGIAGPSGETYETEMDFDRLPSEKAFKSIFEIEKELAEGEGEDDGMRSPTPTPEPSEVEEIENIPDEADEGLDDEPFDEERPETPKVEEEEEVKLPTRPKGQYYYGTWHNGTFHRAKITSADQFTELDKQDILKDLAEQRQRKIEELMRRQKKRAAREQQRQKKEKDRMKAVTAKARRSSPKQQPPAPGLTTDQLMPKRAPHAYELDPRLGSRLVVDDRRRRWHSQLVENNEVMGRSRSSGGLEPLHIPMPSLVKEPPHRAALPMQRHMHVHLHKHHDNLLSGPDSTVGAGAARDGGSPQALPRINSKASYSSQGSLGGRPGLKMRALSEADLPRPYPYQHPGLGSPPSKSSWRIPALQADGVVAGR